MARRRNNNNSSGRSARSGKIQNQSTPTPGTNMVWTNETIERTDFMVFRDSTTDKIRNVVAPNGLQVGLFDDNFLGDLNVTGNITGSQRIFAGKNVVAKLGFSGSLQKLVDGSNYLVQGSNVTITNNANGSITIASNASATTANALTAGAGLSFTAGSNFDGSAVRALAVDINSESQVTPADGDFVLIHDLTDGSIKKTTVGLIKGAAGIDIAGLSNSLNEGTVASGDLIAVADVNDSNTAKKMTIEDLGDYLAAGTNAGIGSSTGQLTIDLADLSDATVDVGNDLIAIIDNGSGNSSKKESISDLVSLIRGASATTGLTSAAGVMSVDINSLSTATPASADQIMIYDADATALKKVAFSSFGGAPTDAQYVVLSANDTLSAETVLSASNGVILSGATLSTNLKTSGGLKIDDADGKMSVEPANFVGTGLEDDGSDNIRISTAAAGTGLTGGGGSALSVVYGNTAGKAVQGNTTFTLVAGHALSGGSNALALGSNISSTLDVQPEEFAGLGLSTSSNKNNVYLQGGANITVTTGSQNQLAIAVNSTFATNKITSQNITGSLTKLTDGSAYLLAGDNINISTGSNGAITIATDSDILSVAAGSGLTGGGTEGALTLNIGQGTGLKVNANDIQIDNTVVATLTGSIFSGPVKASNLSGSLTHLADGSSYLIAGNNITIATGSTGAVTINATSAGGGAVGTITQITPGTGISGGGSSGNVTVSVNNAIVATLTGSQFSGNVGVTGSLGIRGGLSGSLTHLADGSSYLIAGSGIAITSGSSGSVTIATSASPGVLGDAEDDDYTDGLFTDFTTSTPVGTAVDRFNEVLKGLAPGAAPNLDDIDCDDSGSSAKLSFGNSQSITGYTNARPSTLTPSSNLSDVDINGTFSNTSASNDLRMGCFGSITTIDGTLNEDVSADGSNYNADSFGDGNQGSLKLFVNNNSTPIHTTDLSSFGSGNSLNGNGSGFNLTATTPGHFSDGSNFTTFQHRQGTYTIVAADQRNGWNYARIVHTVGGSDRVTNYVEWVNDPTGAGVAMSTSGASLGSLSMTGTKNLSGVKYHTGGSAAYSVTIANAYRNVYPTGNITFGGSNTSVSSQSVPSINHGGGEDETKSIALSNLSVTVTGTSILNGSISVDTNLTHPLKTNLSSAASQSISGILLYNVAEASNDTLNTTENFAGESYRMANATYSAQGDVGGSNVWDSTDSLLSIDGLLVYNQTLIAPKQGANSGNFAGITNGPGSNVNYSTITSGTRTYFRKFVNNSGGSKTNFNLTINGSGTIVANGGTLNTTNIKVFCKMPSNGSASTGFMDLATSFASGQVADNDGCLVGSLDSSLDATNEVTFGTQSVGSNEFIIIKVLADASWTGNISQMSISWI